MLVVVFIILVGFTLHGYKRGLVSMVFSLAAVFLAAALASFLTPYTESFLREQTPLHGAVQEKCLEALKAKAEETGQGAAPPMGQVFGIELPQEAWDLIQENILDKAGELAEDRQLWEGLAGWLADMVVQRAAWALSFVVVGILLGIAVHALDILTRLPVIKGMNHLGGVAFGLLEGLLAVWGIFLLAALCQGSAYGRQVMASIEGSAFLRFLYQNNPLESLINTFLG